MSDETQHLVDAFDRSPNRRKDIAVGRQRARKMTHDEINEMFAINGVEWGDLDDGVPVGATYDNYTLRQRIENGYYNELDTPEELLGRVRGKLAQCTHPDDIAIGNSIIDTLRFDGIQGLTEEQLAWAPKAKSYAERRSALEQQVEEKLKPIRASVPQGMAKELDDDFMALCDLGGKEKKQTQREGLWYACLAWLGRLGRGKTTTTPDQKVEAPVREDVKELVR